MTVSEEEDYEEEEDYDSERSETWDTVKDILKGIGIIAVILAPVELMIHTVRGQPLNKLKLIVFHVCEKPDIHAPDVQHIFQQILDQGKYSVALIPEYNSNEDFEKLLVFLAQFEEPYPIPIMLNAFEAGTLGILNSIDQITRAMNVCNVIWLRTHEIWSYHRDNKIPFPTAWVLSILQFCRQQNLKLFWSEWDTASFDTVRNTIKGYEDIVTVAFSTNSATEPTAGFNLIKGLLHWGASIQAWYWVTRHGQDPSTLMDMPIELMVEHSVLAKNLGAEVIQFEPYWYFFDNGIARPSLGTVLGAL